MGWNEESTDAEELQETMKNLEVWILVSSSYGTRAQHALLQNAQITRHWLAHSEKMSAEQVLAALEKMLCRYRTRDTSAVCM